MKRTKNYEESLLKALQDPEEALAYLNATLVDEDQEVLILVLQHIIKAQIMLDKNYKKENALKKNKHIGTDFDDFLKEKGILEEVELAAIKMVIADVKKSAKTSAKKKQNRIL